ncbi:MAG: class I SAM-dependent methyltransferase [Candidatus Obscuribacterales bacterium]
MMKTQRGGFEGVAFRPVDVATEHSMEFLRSNLPLSPELRLLEVGCGNGDLAAALMKHNVSIKAIDIDEEAVNNTRARGVDVEHADILQYKCDAPYDVILFSRCLHHVNPMPDAVKAAKALLKPDGKVVLEEFAPELADQVTATWLKQQEDLLRAAGLMHNEHDHKHGHEQGKEHVSGDALSQWNDYYFVAHNLSRSDEMRAALQREFSTLEESSCAYLFRNPVRFLVKNETGVKVARELLAAEEQLIALGVIKSIGWRVIASMICAMFIAVFASSSTSAVGFSQNFPGDASEIVSPNGLFTVRNINESLGRNIPSKKYFDPKQLDNHQLVLTKKGSKAGTPVFTYQRNVDVIWSPDSTAFIVNDFMGSNLAFPYLLQIKDPTHPVEFADRFVDAVTDKNDKRNLTKSDHVYIKVTKWLSPQSVEIKAFGHNTDSFEMFYSWDLHNKFQRLAHR